MLNELPDKVKVSVLGTSKGQTVYSEHGRAVYPEYGMKVSVPGIWDEGQCTRNMG